MTSALTKQVAGDHYKRRAIQVVEFWQRNHWDGCACSAMKYLDRYQVKDGIVGLQKSKHFIELREELGGCLPNTFPPVNLTMALFVEANQITGADREALMLLEDYVLSAPDFRASAANRVIQAIDDIITALS